MKKLIVVIGLGMLVVIGYFVFNNFPIGKKTCLDEKCLYQKYVNGIFYQPDPARENLFRISKINVKSFERIDDHFFKDKNGVYGFVFGRAGKFDVITDVKEFKNIDAESFEKLDGGYFRDKNNIYRGQIKGGTNMYEVLDETKVTKLPRGYEKNEDGIFYLGEKIINADPSTFEVITDTSNKIHYYYSKDKNNVYKNGKIFDIADSNTFKELHLWLHIDKNNLYVDGEIVKNVDPLSFKILGHGYGKDEKYIYYLSLVPQTLFDHQITKIDEADISTFKVINRGYAKDKNNCYERGKKTLMYNCAQFE